MEKLMYYIWLHRLFSAKELKTTDGLRVQVIDPGRQNTDSGPDFFNAKIKIGEKLWAGNVEIHQRSSDWLRHNHQQDKAYDSVILHVVEKADCEIFRMNGEPIPQLEMECSPRFREDYVCLVQRDAFLPCGHRLAELPPLLLPDWIGALSIERLQQKSDRILNWLDMYKGSWEDVCYITFSRTLGFGTNSDTFERLARSLPLLFMQKHADSLFQIEAFLFGQAGLLEREVCGDDVYYNRLCDEYAFLKNKFGLTPINGDSWKFFRLRPANFPHQRIAILAQIIHQGFSLFSQICERKEEKEFRDIFHFRLSGYWDTHYAFGQQSPSVIKVLGNTAIDIILINTVAPLLYSYGIKVGSDLYCDRALFLLESLRPEENMIIRQFREVGIQAKNALESQALIQLHKIYCDSRKCLYCRIGHKLLSQMALK